MKSIVAVLVVLVVCAGANATLLSQHAFEGNWNNGVPVVMQECQ